jgi:hypothetical protein
MLADVCRDFGASEVGDIEPRGSATADLGRRNHQSVEKVDEESVSALVPVAADARIITTVLAPSNGRLDPVGRKRVARASRDDQVCEREQLLGSMPAVDLRVCVDADDEEDLLIGVRASDIA